MLAGDRIRNKVDLGLWKDAQSSREKDRIQNSLKVRIPLSLHFK
jgi:hypothetical protein